MVPLMPTRTGAQPQLPRGERRTKFVKIYLTPGEHKLVDQLATKAGQTASAWGYEVLAPLLLPAHLPPDPNQPELPLATTQEES